MQYTPKCACVRNISRGPALSRMWLSSEDFGPFAVQRPMLEDQSETQRCGKDILKAIVVVLY